MSCSSSERRLANRPAVSAIIVFVALLLAALSGGMPKAADFPGQGGVEQPASAASASRPAAPGLEVADYHPRQQSAPARSGVETRSYHPSFETSNSAGALGFWILTALCAALLTAGFAPWLLQWLRSRS